MAWPVTQLAGSGCFSLVCIDMPSAADGWCVVICDGLARESYFYPMVAVQREMEKTGRRKELRRVQLRQRRFKSSSRRHERNCNAQGGRGEIISRCVTISNKLPPPTQKKRLKRICENLWESQSRSIYPRAKPSGIGLNVAQTRSQSSLQGRHTWSTSSQWQNGIDGCSAWQTTMTRAP